MDFKEKKNAHKYYGYGTVSKTNHENAPIYNFSYFNFKT